MRNCKLLYSLVQFIFYICNNQHIQIAIFNLSIYKTLAVKSTFATNEVS
jgi:hypothetical protein